MAIPPLSSEQTSGGHDGASPFIDRVAGFFIEGCGCWGWQPDLMPFVAFGRRDDFGDGIHARAFVLPRRMWGCVFG